MAKPFIAARVPEVIDEKLRERVESTGASRTDIVISALAQYLGCSIEVPVETNAVDRLVAIEKRVEALERKAEQLLQSTLDKTEVNTSVGGIFTHRDIENLTGIKYGTVRSKHRYQHPIEHKGITFIPIKHESGPRWQAR